MFIVWFWQLFLKTASRVLILVSSHESKVILSFRWFLHLDGLLASKATKTSNLQLKVRNMPIIWVVDPIEQNVNGNKGLYELVYFMKDSRPIERFKKAAAQMDKLSQDKTDDQIEKLV